MASNADDKTRETPLAIFPTECWHCDTDDRDCCWLGIDHMAVLAIATP
jgi:hypothetical protein